nr:hypothetical protein GCM10017745_41520 [Saccharothrix mutabilis subsp. capreolus]
MFKRDAKIAPGVCARVSGRRPMGLPSGADERPGGRLTSGSPGVANVGRREWRTCVERHEHVKVVGSLNLVQTLLKEKLFDRLDLWVHPIVLGGEEGVRRRGCSHEPGVAGASGCWGEGDRVVALWGGSWVSWGGDMRSLEV